jgi:adenosylcobinamide kinase / adenosylcobinamide-phosphate guanylyltransferase
VRSLTETTKQRHLILGGARSGKTRHALNVATAMAASCGGDVVYVATAEAGDSEMEDRIRRHRFERPAHWRTLEAPRQLAQVLTSVSSESVVIVDCLTLWLSNALMRDFREDAPMSELPTWSAERAELMRHLESARPGIVLVSNEVGGGIVPMAPIARRFQSEQGWLNQAVASVCEHVTLVVAGIPMTIKSKPSQGRSE